MTPDLAQQERQCIDMLDALAQAHELEMQIVAAQLDGIRRQMRVAEDQRREEAA